jgi:hypothetical protein
MLLLKPGRFSKPSWFKEEGTYKLAFMRWSGDQTAAKFIPPVNEEITRFFIYHGDDQMPNYLH